MKKTVLFLCTHNSCRSQMAEGLLKKFYGNRFKVFSAGIKATSVHRLAVIVMDEIRVDISEHRSKSIYEFKDKNFDYVITVCDNSREKCPFFPGKHILHKDFEDPGLYEGSYEEKIDRFRIVRDEIREWVGNLVDKEILI